jgi:GTPase Era involved in 16S rRNA processing
VATNRFRVVVEVVVDAKSEEEAKAEIMSRFLTGREQVKILEINEEAIPAQLLADEEEDWEELSQPTYKVVVEFTAEEAKHLYNLMRIVYDNLRKDPDFSPQMVEAQTISKMIDALDESMGEIIHGF